MERVTALLFTFFKSYWILIDIVASLGLMLSNALIFMLKPLNCCSLSISMMAYWHFDITYSLFSTIILNKGINQNNCSVFNLEGEWYTTSESYTLFSIPSSWISDHQVKLNYKQNFFEKVTMYLAFFSLTEYWVLRFVINYLISYSIKCLLFKLLLMVAKIVTNFLLKYQKCNELQ
jgi:hypothetical protein